MARRYTQTDNTTTPPPLQPSYNSGSTRPISMKVAPVDAPYALSSAVWNIVTFGDLCDLERSIKRFRLLQPSYNSGSTGTISMKIAPVDAPYAISSAVWNMVTFGDLCDLSGEIVSLTFQGHRGHRRSPYSKRLMKSHTARRLVLLSSKSAR